jgi:superoxide dismutase, Cu-Zn family
MKRTGFALIILAAAAGCGVAGAATGSAHIHGVAEGSALSGHLLLTETPEGLKVSASFQNASPGKHGFHIHENGSCGDGGKEAGGHYNPAGAPHGLLSKDGFERAHAGDFGNVEIAADGTGTHEALLPGLTLTEGKYPVMGKAVIFHENEDDFGQPVGNAGGRIGCGIIGGGA